VHAYNQLLAIGPALAYGTGEPFQVVAGAPAHLIVDLRSSEGEAVDVVEAGEPFSLGLLLTDDFGNECTFSSGAMLTVSDDTNTIACSSSELMGTQALLSDCRITRSSSLNFITVAYEQSGLEAVKGVSGLFDVHAAMPDAIEISVPEEPIVAGTPFPVTLQVVDAYGNPVEDGTGEVSLQDAPPDAQSELTSVAALVEDGTAQLELTLKRALEVTYLSASSDALAVDGLSMPIRVVYAAPTLIDVVIDETVPIVAGQEAGARLRVFDAYRNPALGYEGTISLNSEYEDIASEDFRVMAFELGEADAFFTLTTAVAANRLVVNDSAGAAGTSDVFEVHAALPAAIRLSEVGPVVWAGEPFSLTVQVVDAHENVVPTFHGTIRLDDQTGSLALAGSSGDPMVSIDNGTFTGNFTIGQSISQNLLRATSEGLVGVSLPFPVYSLTCNSTPVATLTADEDDTEYTVACLPPRGGTVPISFQAELPSSVVVEDYVWNFGSGESVRTSRSEVTHYFQTRGRLIVKVAAVDERLCATWSSLTVYIGLDDGSPAGPVAVTSPTSALSPISSPTALVTVTARDCGGDIPADGFDMTVQSTLGDVVLPNDLDLSADRGLQFTLEGGIGELELDVSSVRQGDEARLVMIYGQGEAEGAIEFMVKDDQSPPFVVDYGPRGLTQGMVSSLWIEFNEAIRRETALALSTIDVTSSVRGPVNVSARSLEAGDTLLRLTLDPPVDLNSQPDRVTVSLPSGKLMYSITDAPEGNRLDGNWDGTADPAGDPFEFMFGNLDVPVSSGGASSCQVEPALFSPDGQGGEGVGEADWVRVTGQISASSGLHAYVVEILESNGIESLARLWVPVGDLDGDGSSDTAAAVDVTWDGRGLDRQVVANGIYPFAIWAIDVNDNWLTSSCAGDTSLVEIMNPIDLGAYQ